MELAKVQRAAEEQRNKDSGISGDVDFNRMIKLFRHSQAPKEQVHLPTSEKTKICICVRKRPISSKELARNDSDSVTCANPVVVVHDCKLKVDGISKYLDNTSFEFDHTFHENDVTESIYECAVERLVDFVLSGGRATVFAYGQTGSGKTYTMQGIQSYVADDLFSLLEQRESNTGSRVLVYVSYFEIYGGRCQDLLNSRQRLNVREDGGGEIIVSELMEMRADTADALHAIIETGNRNRTTHATESNDESSRSHAICQITLRTEHPVHGAEIVLGRFSLIDLAGSERGADTKSHNRQRRMEGAEINKSLLALKECIRALDSGSSHVPYRASKLTLVLKDSFTNKKSRTVMIVNVSPAASSADHTLNTLRYADRIKERVVGGQAARYAAAAAAHAQQEPESKALPPAPRNRNPESAKQSEAADKPPAAAPPVRARGSGGDGTKDTPSSAKQNNGQPNSASKYHSRDNGAIEEDSEDAALDAFHRTVQDVFEEEESLLNLHMSIIQENAELLTEEGRLLQQIQGENNDIDAYAARLDEILMQKQKLINTLKDKLDHFRSSLQKEERESRIIGDRFAPY